MTQGWQKVSSKIVHQNPWYHVSEDDVVLPNGKTGKYYPVNTHGGVMVVAINEGGEICLVRQSRYTGESISSLELIGGGMKAPQSPLENAQRELKEETGLIAKTWIDIGNDFPFLGIASEKMYYFVAQDLEETNTQFDETEDIEISWKNVEEIKRLIIENQIIDGETITGIFRYILYKENQ